MPIAEAVAMVVGELEQEVRARDRDKVRTAARGVRPARVRGLSCRIGVARLGNRVASQLDGSRIITARRGPGEPPFNGTESRRWCCPVGGWRLAGGRAARPPLSAGASTGYTQGGNPVGRRVGRSDPRGPAPGGAATWMRVRPNRSSSRSR